MKFRIDSIIFDLDGTLWDVSQIEIKIINDIINEKYDVPTITLEELCGVMGYSTDEAACKLFGENNKEIGLKILNESIDGLHRYLKKYEIEAYNTVKETLELLRKKYRLFIVSNCQKGYIETFLDNQDLNHLFEDYECIGRTGLSKGNNIKLIIERNNLLSPIYVGDTQKDYDATKFAKIPFIHAKYGFGNVEDCDASIPTFKDILNLV